MTKAKPAGSGSNKWVWVITLHKWVGRLCKLETMEGVRREGEITSVDFQVLVIQQEDGNDRTVYLPNYIELNNDPTDRFEFHRMKTFQLCGIVDKEPEEPTSFEEYGYGYGD